MANSILSLVLLIIAVGVTWTDLSGQQETKSRTGTGFGGIEKVVNHYKQMFVDVENEIEENIKLAEETSRKSTGTDKKGQSSSEH